MTRNRAQHWSAGVPTKRRSELWREPPINVYNRLKPPTRLIARHGFLVLLDCAYRKSHPGQELTSANHKFGPRFAEASRSTRTRRRRLASRALSRNSTKCPIGAGFSVSGCRLRLVVLQTSACWRRATPRADGIRVPLQTGRGTVVESSELLTAPTDCAYRKSRSE
jgi:hypothetical protein